MFYDSGTLSLANKQLLSDNGNEENVVHIGSSWFLSLLFSWWMNSEKDWLWLLEWITNIG